MPRRYRVHIAGEAYDRQCRQDAINALKEIGAEVASVVGSLVLVVMAFAVCFACLQ